MSQSAETKCRAVGATELSWCRAVPGGTGITVLALLFSKSPDVQFLQSALRKLQISHPILNSKLRFNPASNSFSYVTPQSPQLEIHPIDLQTTAEILRAHSPSGGASIPPLQLVLEHELNKNSWQNPDSSDDVDLFFASLYTLEKNMWVLALRLHTSACDRAAAAALMSELVAMMEEKEGIEGESGNEMKVSRGIDDCIPCGQDSKPFWARGVDMLGYSLNSFRLANLSFKDTTSPRLSRVVRLRMNAEDTGRILSVSKLLPLLMFDFVNVQFDGEFFMIYAKVA